MNEELLARIIILVSKNAEYCERERMLKDLLDKDDYVTSDDIRRIINYPKVEEDED